MYRDLKIDDAARLVAPYVSMYKQAFQNLITVVTV